MDNEYRNEWIAEVLQKDVSDMRYVELVVLTLEFRDEEELDRWSEGGDEEYDRISEEYEAEHGVAYPIRKDAPQKVKEAYERLCEIDKDAASKGIVID